VALKAEQYVSQAFGDRFAASDLHPQDAAGVELDSLSRADDRDKRGGVESGLRIKTDGDAAALTFDG
jgi:hypothetical protein